MPEKAKYVKLKSYDKKINRTTRTTQDPTSS